MSTALEPIADVRRGVERTSLLPLGASVDAAAHVVAHDDDADDLITQLGRLRFVRGEEPHAVHRGLDRVRKDAVLRPLGAEVVRTYSSRDLTTELCEGPGWTLVTRRWLGGSASVDAYARSAELAAAVVAEASQDVEEPIPDDHRARAPVWFWNLARQPDRRRRILETPAWADARDSYASAPRAALDRLHALRADDLLGRGRLVLLHGPPGTGKTTALRSLASSWRDWCDLDVILDPEKLFANASYLLGVAMGERDEDACRRHRLIVLEDCDELIGGDAKAGAGQALARLLNLTDGMLGQGLDVLVAVTTNEPLQRLHPAVVRPGRCLAEIEIGRFPRAEAAAWLGASADAVPSDGLTLAELLTRRGDLAAPAADPDDGAWPGQYL